MATVTIQMLQTYSTLSMVSGCVFPGKGGKLQPVRENNRRKWELVVESDHKFIGIKVGDWTISAYIRSFSGTVSPPVLRAATPGSDVFQVLLTRITPYYLFVTALTFFSIVPLPVFNKWA